MNRWIVFKSIFTKTIIEMKRYIFDTISRLITLYIVFALLFFWARAIGWVAFQAGETLEGLVVGYMVWMLAMLAYQDMAWNISMEAKIGTLEQLFLSPAGFTWVNISFLLSRFLLNLAFTGVMLLLMMLTSGYWLHIDLVSLIPLIVLTISASYGFGFIMGGLALVFKRIQSSFQILQFIFIAFIAAPLSRFPWVKYLPLAMGNHLLRQVMVHGIRLWQLPPADLLTAAIVGAGYFLLGLAVFTRCTGVARNRGLLGQY
ncbi:MAG: ABC transporter permease [Dethiobacteria bacterium]